MGENYLFKYNVDMVFCIDATASMRPVISKKQCVEFLP